MLVIILTFLYIYKRRIDKKYSSLLVPTTRLVVLTCNPSKVRNRNVEYLWLLIEQGANKQRSTELCRKEQAPVASDRRWRKKSLFPDLALRRITKFNGKIYKTLPTKYMHTIANHERNVNWFSP